MPEKIDTVTLTTLIDVTGVNAQQWVCVVGYLNCVTLMPPVKSAN